MGEVSGTRKSLGYWSASRSEEITEEIVAEFAGIIPPLTSCELKSIRLPAVPNGDLTRQQLALREAFGEHRELLLGILRKYLRALCGLSVVEAVELSRDMLGDWYEAAMKTAERFDTGRSPLPWLLGIGYYLALHKRDEQVRRFKRELLWGDLPCVGNESVHDAFERIVGEEVRLRHSCTPREEHEREERESLGLLLGSLSAPDREVLELAVRGHVSGEALARVLRVSPLAARQRLCRARKRLHEARHAVERGIF